MKRRKSPPPKLVKGEFEAAQFTPTQWSSAQDKANFANHLVKFIESRFAPHLWVLWFYRRLSDCFGHIAHFNEHGFWDEWFRTNEDRVRWLEYISKGGIYAGFGSPPGDAAFTFSDVERDIMRWLRENPFHLIRARATRDVEREGIERAQLDRLKTKYEPEPNITMPMKRSPGLRQLVRAAKAAHPSNPAPAAPGTLTAAMLGAGGSSGVGITCGKCAHAADFEFFATLNPREFECPACHHAWRIETGKVVAVVGGMEVRERKVVVKELSLAEECARQLQIFRQHNAA